MTDRLRTRTLVRGDADAHRRSIRYVAAVASSLTALLYFGIGLGVLRVVDVSPSGPSLFDFGMPAGSAFVLGAVLLFAVDRRSLWLFGALLQVAVIVMYFVVAPQRTPSFEIWGVLIKVLQATILAALVYLLVHPPVRRVH